MQWQAIAELLARAVGAIDKIIEGVRTKDDDPVAARAKDALTVIGVIIDTVKTGDLEKLDLKEANTQLDRVIAALDSNDTAADAALDKKFDNSNTFAD